MPPCKPLFLRARAVANKSHENSFIIPGQPTPRTINCNYFLLFSFPYKAIFHLTNVLLSFVFPIFNFDFFLSLAFYFFLFFWSCEQGRILFHANITLRGLENEIEAFKGEKDVIRYNNIVLMYFHVGKLIF